MNKAMRTRLLASAAVAVSAIAATAGMARADTTLTFVWHAGTCADALMDIAKDYPDKSVKIVPALVPYGPQWHDKIASEFAIQGDAFDFAMWDSQSTAEFGRTMPSSSTRSSTSRATSRPISSRLHRCLVTANIPTAQVNTTVCRPTRTHMA